MIKGINQNFSPEGTPEGYAFYGKNIIINERLDEVINEKGNSLVQALVDNNTTNIVGVITFGSRVIIFYKTLLNLDTIAVYEEDSASIISKLERTDLLFNIDFPVTGKAKLNSKGDLIVAFTDNNVNPKYINLTTATPADNIDIYNLFLQSHNPDINIEIIEGGGVLKTGVDFVVFRYVDVNKATSNYSQLSSPVYIVDHSNSQSYITSQGTKSGVITDKAIKINLTNLDTSFKSLQVVLISRIADVITVQQFKEVSFNSSSLSVTITGAEIATTLSLSEVLTVNQSYDTVEGLESLNDQLFLFGLKASPVLDFQKLANQISIQWKSTPIYNAIKVPDNRLRRDGNKSKTFIHGEIYALYAQIELLDGKLTNWFTIPGRVVAGSEQTSSPYANGVRLNGNVPKKYQLEDTCSLTAVVGDISSIGTGYTYGVMSAWENSDEVYPDNFPDFAGQPVRHHKMPSMIFMKEHVYNTDRLTPSDANEYPKNCWDILGLRFSINSIPSEFVGKFSSIRIGYAKRDEANITVLGYDIIQLAANPEKSEGSLDLTTITGAGGNWRVQASGSGNDIEGTNAYFRLHSPDIFILKPSLNSIYLENIIGLTLNNMNNAYSSGGYGRLIQGRQDLSSEDVYTYISDFTLAESVNQIDLGHHYIALENSKYMPANVALATSDVYINNLLNEQALYTKPEISLSVGVSGVSSGGLFKVVSGGGTDSPNLLEDTRLIALKILKSSLFVSYTDQQIVPIQTIIRNPVVSTIYDISIGDADGFICLYSFLAMASEPGASTGPFNFTANDGIRCVKQFLCESRYNLNERYSDISDLTTYYYPFAQSTVLSDSRNYWYEKLDQTSCDVNKILYTKEFNALNDFEPYGVFNHRIVYQNSLPYAIARGQKSSRDNDLDDGWRKFKPNDIFFTTKDKGTITNLVAWGTDSLIIHHKYAILKTRDKAVLQTDITTISLGSGDLFELEPREVNPTSQGYGGTQHRYSCLLCEAGYIFLDAEVGEFMLYSGGQNYDVITKGFKNFFRDVFRNNPVGNNPFNNTAIVTAFDKEHYRLILSLKASENSFTASYDLIQGEWSCTTDYKPDYIFNTRRNLYSFKQTLLYKHNHGAYGNFYGITYPSFVDIIINNDKNTEKILHAIRWISRVEKDKVNKDNETITSITIWNDYYCSGKIDINKRDNLATYEGKNTNQLDSIWSFSEIFNKIKDKTLPFISDIANDYKLIDTNIIDTLPWFNKASIRGKYFIIRLEYSNIEDKLVSLRSITPELEQSYN